jgi:hypothetical protein
LGLSGLCVLITIDLDNKAHFETDEVGREHAERVLTAEFEAIETPGAQRLPELAFGIAHAFSKLAGALIGHENV